MSIVGMLNDVGIFTEGGAIRLEQPLHAHGGIIGFPHRDGKVYYVDPANGSDNSSGRTPRQALATILAGYNKLTANQHDTLVYIAGSSSASLSATLTWAKNYTHFHCIASPTNIAQRARIFNSGNITPLLTISATGSSFKNFYIFQGGTGATELQNVKVTGGRNYFENVHFAGMGNATPADETGASSLSLSDAEENLFVNCTVGLDTIARSTTNAELELLSASRRNTFRNCTFLSFADNAGHLFVKIDGAGDMDRWIKFEDCDFINAVESTATTMDQAMNVHNSAGGMVLLKGNTTIVGCTNVAAADNGNVYISGAAPAAGTSGLAVAVTR